MLARAARVEPAEYHYYKCVKAKKFDGCDKKAIKKDPVEKSVLDTIVKYIFVDEVISEISERVAVRQEKENTTISIYQRELSALTHNPNTFVNRDVFGFVVYY